MPQDEQSKLLIRLDERTKTILDRLDHFVIQEEFQPVKKLVYGIVSLILFGVIGALIGLVLVPKVSAYLGSVI